MQTQAARDRAAPRPPPSRQRRARPKKKRVDLLRASAGVTPPIEELSSQLLAEVFAPWEPPGSLQVLDLGGGEASTLEFLSRYDLQIFFADLLRDPPGWRPEEEPSQQQILDRLNKELGLETGRRLDVILFWDYLHYLDTPALEALSSVLYPHVHNHTRAYALGAIGSTSQTEKYRYAINDAQSLILRPASNDAHYYAHSQQTFNHYFTTLTISRATLLRNGRLELMFTSPW